MKCFQILHHFGHFVVGWQNSGAEVKSAIFLPKARPRHDNNASFFQHFTTVHVVGFDSQRAGGSDGFGYT
jgi:hypothetical protein